MQSWESIYIYYTEAAEPLLVDTLLPLLTAAHSSGELSTYFFIRYQDEQGEHIRLRWVAATAVAQAAFQDSLESALQRADYLFRYARYIPETARFGGEVGLALAEKSFFLSSQQVLQLLHEQRNTWAYGHALSAALRLHLDLLLQLDFSRTDAISFFKQLADEWLKANFYRQDENVSAATLQTLLAAYYAEYDRMLAQGDLRQNLRQQWEEHAHYEGFNTPTLITTLQLVQQSAPLLDATLYKPFWQQLDEDTALYWSFLADYIHLTNNRLGVDNFDEPMLLYLLAQSL